MAPMSVRQRLLQVRAPRRGLHDITPQVADAVSKAEVKAGVCNLFLRHTSASLVLSENWDPTARQDLEAFFDRLVPEGAEYFRHTLEGPDDMPSHIKSVLTQVSLTIPILDGRLALGTWQGIFLFEHRDQPSTREVVVSIF